MLRVDKKARFTTEGAWFWKRHRFTTGKLVSAHRLRPAELAEFEALQREEPVALIRADGRQWWWCHGAFYWEDDGLSAHDVMALVAERERRKRRQLERAHALMHQDIAGTPRREPIPREIKLAVWQRDGGRCVDCGSNFDLQYDHVIPFSLGGATSVKNLQLLCGDCNRTKGAAL
jgi:5-methylcytosine-specific restriction endonuclease McrA